jgi:hypothetical protein
MSKKEKLSIVIELAWLLMAAFCIIAGIIYQSKIGFDKVWLFYVLGVISIGMFFVRRQQRKNTQKRKNRIR